MGYMPTSALVEQIKRTLMKGRQTAAPAPSLSAPVDLAQARVTPQASNISFDPDLAQPAPIGEGEGLVRRGAVPPPTMRVDPSAQPEAVSAPSGLSQPGDLAASRINPPTPSRFTPRPEYHDPHEPGKPIGLAGRILHTLGGIGLGAMRGAAYGPGGMIGGAAAGGIGAGINPNRLHRMQYESQTLPMWRQRHEDEAALAKSEQGAAESESRIANINTDNDLALRRQQSVEAEQKARDTDRTDRLGETVHQHRAANAQAAKAEHDLRHPGEPYPPNVTSEMPWLKNERAPVRAGKERAPWGHGVDKNGAWTGVYDDVTGEPKVIRPSGGQGIEPTRDPNELTAWQKRQYEHQQGQDERRDRKDEESRVNKAAADLRRGQDAVDRYLRLKNAPIGTAKGQMTEQEKEDARVDALHAVQEIASTHPDYLEGAEGVGSVPYIKWKGGKRPEVESAPRQRAKGAGSQPKTGHKVGDVVNVGGKQVKIGKIYPDGSFDPE